jgi:glycerol kinase
MLDNVDGARERAENGELLFGTVDSWLIWNLTGGAAHVTDYSNAGRTQLFNINTLEWDPKLLEELQVPRAMLPELNPSSKIYGHTDPNVLFGTRVPVAAAVGDQHGALFGQACFEAGMVKCTYGTGGSLLMNTGNTPIPSESGLLTTMAWGLPNRVEYALEGLLFIMGASVQWLRDELEMVKDSAETETLAREVEDTNGVYVVPAFTGLSAPYWDQYARGTIVGLTRGANRRHIVRATLESMAYQIKDVISCMESDSGFTNSELKVDGGAAKNDFLMQFQADLLGVPVLRPKIVESTARGSAFLAGLATEFWRDQDELVDSFELDKRFEPEMDESRREELYAGWQRAVERAKDWEMH